MPHRCRSSRTALALFWKMLPAPLVPPEASHSEYRLGAENGPGPVTMPPSVLVMIQQPGGVCVTYGQCPIPPDPCRCVCVLWGVAEWDSRSAATLSLQVKVILAKTFGPAV